MTRGGPTVGAEAGPVSPLSSPRVSGYGATRMYAMIFGEGGRGLRFRAYKRRWLDHARYLRSRAPPPVLLRSRGRLGSKTYGLERVLGIACFTIAMLLVSQDSPPGRSRDVGTLHTRFGSWLVSSADKPEISRRLTSELDRHGAGGG